MVYFSTPPVKIDLYEDHRLIILTRNKIMFSSLDSVEDYLTLPIIGNNPKTFYHAADCQQTLIHTQSTI